MNQTNRAEEIIKSITKISSLGILNEEIYLHEPFFKDTKAYEYVKDCLDSGWVSSSGDWVNRFEKQLCIYTKAKFCIAVSNGTVALRLALNLVDVKPKDEVIIPPMTFVASANAVSHCGAIPHFVDIEEKTLGMCPIALEKRLNEIGKRVEDKIINRETKRRIAAIMPVHIFGNPASCNEIRKVADKWGLPIIEDAAESLGSWRTINGKKVHCGLFGEIGAISFNGNKLITTGGGGALITNNEKIALLARHLSTTAKINHQWEFEHDQIGWNDRLPNINASLGVAQMEDLERRIIAKRKLNFLYNNEFKKFTDIEIIVEPNGCISNYWMNTLRLCQKNIIEVKELRERILEISHQKSLYLRPVWKLLNHLPMYKDCPKGNTKIAEDQAYRLINLPSSPQILLQN